MSRYLPILALLASIACDRNAAHRVGAPAEGIEFQLDGMRHTGDAL